MSIRLKASAAKKMLEPDVIAEGLDDEAIAAVSDEHILLSIAVSLKRLADQRDIKVDLVTPGKPQI